MADNQNNPFNLPTERIDLPSKGWFYPESNPLSKGYVEIMYPTAKHEDILTNLNYLQKGIAQDKFLEAVLATRINFKDLLQGDKDAIMIAARILAYGKDYAFKRDNKRYTVDLTTLEDKPMDESLFGPGKVEFDFYLPVGKAAITYKYLTLKDEDDIEKEEASMKKLFPDFSGDSTLFLRQSIVAVNGDRTKGIINKFVDSILIADSKAFRSHYLNTRPGIDMTANAVGDNGEVLEGFRVPITVDFFWPES